MSGRAGTRRPHPNQSERATSPAFRSEPVSRTTVPAVDIPDPWLDRLLEALETPASDGSVVDMLLAAATELAPEVSFAVRVAPPESGRAFPEMANERVYHLESPEGHALYIGSDEAEVLVLGRVPLLAGRLASLLGFALRIERHAGILPTYAAGDEQAATTPVDVSPMDPLRPTDPLSPMDPLHHQLAQAQKLAGVGQLAAGIMHEVNNTLTLVVGYADYLKRKADKMRFERSDIEKLECIAQAGERLRRFSRDLIDYTRPPRVGLTSVMIHDAIERALSFCGRLLADSGVRVQRRFLPSSPVVQGAEAELVHVFVNLVTNACHAMQPAGGNLRVETDYAGDGQVVISVVDSGHGIAPEHRSRIFEPFFTTKGDGRGSGLGLSVVRTIVERHAGVIDVDSTPGAGTRFTLRLPAIVER